MFLDFRRKGATQAKGDRSAYAFSLLTTLRGPGTSATILLSELSSTGFQAECIARFKPGTKVRINLPGLGPVDAHVASARRTLISGLFESRIDVARCIAARNGQDTDVQAIVPASDQLSAVQIG